MGPRKRYTPEQITSFLREAEVSQAQGRTLSQVSKTLAGSEQSSYRRRKE